MKKYKVLWFDDEHEKFSSIKDEALLENVQLIGFSNSEEGCPELRANYMYYDAIILDGKFFKSKEQKGTEIDNTAFGEVAIVLNELKVKGVLIPSFIYSGQPDFVKGKDTLIDIFKSNFSANGKVFDKNIEADFEELLKQIKKTADENPIRQIKINYSDVFSVFETGLLPLETENELIDVFLELQKTNDIDFKAVLTKIRSIQEKIFIKLENIDVLPKGLNRSSKFKHLSGNLQRNSFGNYEATSIEYQTKEIQNLQEWIYYTCGTYIHALEKQHFGGYMISKYSLQSLMYGIFEIILWFKKTYKEYK